MFIDFARLEPFLISTLPFAASRKSQSFRSGRVSHNEVTTFLLTQKRRRTRAGPFHHCLCFVCCRPGEQRSCDRIQASSDSAWTNSNLPFYAHSPPYTKSTPLHQAHHLPVDLAGHCSGPRWHNPLLLQKPQVGNTFAHVFSDHIGPVTLFTPTITSRSLRQP